MLCLLASVGCPATVRERPGPAGGGGGGDDQDTGPVADLSVRRDAGAPPLLDGALDATIPADAASPADLSRPGDVWSAPDLPRAPDLQPDLGPQRHPLELGQADTLEVATWNLRNFPSTPQAEPRLAELLLQIDADVVGVQEVADVDTFNSLLGRLPEHHGVLSVDTYGDGSYQKTGLIYRTAQLRLRQARTILDDDGWALPRPPLQGQFELRRAGRPPLELVVIVVHLKASAGATNEERRRAGCTLLAAHVDALLAGDPELAVILVGDFNDSLWDPPRENVFGAFLLAPERYLFVTKQPAVASAWDRRPFGMLIDHVAITQPLFADWEGGTAWVLDLESWFHDYPDVVSDHIPVVAVFPQR